MKREFFTKKIDKNSFTIFYRGVEIAGAAYTEKEIVFQTDLRVQAELTVQRLISEYEKISFLLQACFEIDKMKEASSFRYIQNLC